MRAKVAGPIDPAKITVAYSGKPGCACGCRGKYYYREAARARESERRGYPVKDEEVSDAQVNRIAGIVNANLSGAWQADDGSFVAYDKSEKRTYTVYYGR